MDPLDDFQDEQLSRESLAQRELLKLASGPVIPVGVPTPGLAKATSIT